MFCMCCHFSSFLFFVLPLWAACFVLYASLGNVVFPICFWMCYLGRVRNLATYMDARTS